MPGGVPEADVRDLEASPARTTAHDRNVRVAVDHLAGLGQHRPDPAEPHDTARELSEQPSQGTDRERDDHQQVGHVDHVARVGGPGLHPEHAGYQHGQHPQAGQRLQHRVEDGADRAGADAGVAQGVGLRGEPVGLLLLAAQRLDHHRSVEGLVGDLAELGPQRLHPGHEGRLEALEDQVAQDDEREDDESDRGQHQVGEGHLHDRDHHHRHRAHGHRQRSDRGPGGLHVGVRVGEQLPRRVLLVPRQRQPEVLPGDGAPVVRLHAVLHDARTPPPGDDPDPAQHGDADEEGDHGDQSTGRRHAAVERGQHDVVGRPAQHPGVRDRERAEDHRPQGRDGEHPRLTADGHGEDAEAFPQGAAAGAGPTARAHTRHVVLRPGRSRADRPHSLRSGARRGLRTIAA